MMNGSSNSTNSNRIDDLIKAMEEQTALNDEILQSMNQEKEYGLNPTTNSSEKQKPKNIRPYQNDDFFVPDKNLIFSHKPPLSDRMDSKDQIVCSKQHTLNDIFQTTLEIEIG